MVMFRLKMTMFILNTNTPPPLSAGTEPIVDVACRLGKPFAVVPCCVFPRLFPHRRLPDGREPKLYDDLRREMVLPTLYCNCIVLCSFLVFSVVICY